MNDAVEKLEHDHMHLNRVVESVRQAMRATLRGEREPAELRDVLEEFLKLAQDELYAHFDVEETALFPFLANHFPDRRSTIDSLTLSHDRMCGVLSRLERLLSGDSGAFAAHFDAAVALFARFDANYEAHANDERQLLNDLSTRLTGEQRNEISRMLGDA